LMSLLFLMMTNLCSSSDCVKSTTYDITHNPLCQFLKHRVICH
jgi:hypothetical protein